MQPFIKIPCTLMRGGTSKGLVIKKEDLPSDQEMRDRVILRIYGSPDKRQIDGVGGGTPLTSKLAIVGSPTYPDADIDYTFGQVSIEEAVIDYKPTCGNMSAAVGLFAAEKGYVKLTEPITTVRMYNTNTKKIIEAEIPVIDGKIQYEGDFAIDGVPGTAPCIMINFLDSGGAITGKLLPTGNASDTIELADGRTFDVSVIDSANVITFVRADQVNISGTEIGDAFNSNKELLQTLEAIRVEVGKRIGLIKDNENVTPVSHALPKIAVIAEPQTYTTTTNRVVKGDEIDLIGRYIAMGTLHQAFAVSGGIAMATGAQIPGTIIYETLKDTGKTRNKLFNIGHPSGIISVDVKVKKVDDEYIVTRAAIGRTARTIMEGYAYVPIKLLAKNA